MKYKKFEELPVWKDARVLSKEIGDICKREKQDFAWINQIMKSALSVMSNIAEGHDAQSNDASITFFSYAKRSAAEFRSQIYYGYDQGYLQEKEFHELISKSKKIAAQLYGFMRYLRLHKGQPKQSAV